MLALLGGGGFRSGNVFKNLTISFRKLGDGLGRKKAPSGVSGVSICVIALGKGGLSIKLFCRTLSIILFTGVTWLL